MMNPTTTQYENDIIETTIGDDYNYSIGTDAKTKNWYIKRLATDNVKVTLLRSESGDFIQLDVYEWSNRLGEFVRQYVKDTNYKFSATDLINEFDSYLKKYNVK